MRSRTAKRPGPLQHQQRLHSARVSRGDCSPSVHWETSVALYEAMQRAKPAAIVWENETAAAQARQAGYDAAVSMASQAAQAWTAISASAAPRVPQTEPSSLCLRPVSITDLDDRIVITVGAAELRLSPEEAARLFAIGRGANDKPQQKGGA
jgi:transcription initiation factor TFIID subunit TAF12